MEKYPQLHFHQRATQPGMPTQSTIKRERSLSSSSQDRNEPQKKVKVEESVTLDCKDETSADPASATSKLAVETGFSIARRPKTETKLSPVNHEANATPTVKDLLPTATLPPAIDVTPGINLENKQVIQKSPGLDLVYYKHFVRTPTSTRFMKWCLEELNWYRVQYKTRGMQITTPRFTTVFGIDETHSPASTYNMPPRPIPEPLQILKAHVEKVTGAKFNFTLLNYYQDGKDSITYHSDDESFLGKNPTIASLTLGGCRDFLMKNKVDASKKEKYFLEDGDLLVMQGTTQSQWLHAIPKRATALPRINITFRKAINVAGTKNYYKYNVGDGGIYAFRNGKMVQKETA